MNTLGTLIQTLGIEANRAQVISSGGGRLDFELEIHPEQFLDQAGADLKSGGGAALFNSITNSRRAILCQVDRLLQALGFGIEHLSTKQKTGLLTFLGLPAPNILGKVGDTRNLLEHEYKLPSLDKVEDAYDIALLFTQATERYLDTFWGEFFMGNSDDMIEGDCFHHYHQLSFGFEADDKSFSIQGEFYRGPNIYEDRSIVGETSISFSSPYFKHCIRLALTEISSIPIELAIADLFEELNAE